MLSYVRNVLNGRKKPASANENAKEQAKQDFLAKLSQASTSEEADHLLIELSRAKPFPISGEISRGVSKTRPSRNFKERCKNKVVGQDNANIFMERRPLPVNIKRITTISDSDSDSDSDLELSLRLSPNTEFNSRVDSVSNTGALIIPHEGNANSDDGEPQQSPSQTWERTPKSTNSQQVLYPGTNCSACESNNVNESRNILNKLLLDATARLQAATSRHAATSQAMEPCVTREASVSFDESDQEEIIDLTLSSPEPFSDSSSESSSHAESASEFSNKQHSCAEPKCLEGDGTCCTLDNEESEALDNSTQRRKLNEFFESVMERWDAKTQPDNDIFPKLGKMIENPKDRISEFSSSSESDSSSVSDSSSNDLGSELDSESASDSGSGSDFDTDSEESSDIHVNVDAVEIGIDSDSDSDEEPSDSDVESASDLVVDSDMSSESEDYGTEADSSADSESSSDSAIGSDQDSIFEYHHDFPSAFDSVDSFDIWRNSFQDLPGSTRKSYDVHKKMRRAVRNKALLHRRSALLASLSQGLKDRRAERNRGQSNTATTHDRKYSSLEMMAKESLRKLAEQGRYRYARFDHQ